MKKQDTPLSLPYSLLWRKMKRPFLMAAVRSFREHMLQAGTAHLLLTYSEEELDDWEDMYLMGGPL